MSEVGRKWDAVYSRNSPASAPAEVLCENSCLLPERGTALDLACGLGGNALFLAQRGLAVHAWDISAVALQSLRLRASNADLEIYPAIMDIRPQCLPERRFDVVVVSRFLDRTLVDAIIACLKSGGLLFYQTYTVDKSISHGPTNPAYLLQRNELLRLFAPLMVVYYREFARIGDNSRGLRHEACFVGQKA